VIYVSTMVPADTAAERMQRVREGARAGAATVAARAICELRFGGAAVAGLKEDLEASRLSLSDLEQLGEIIIDHGRSDGPDHGLVRPSTARRRDVLTQGLLTRASGAVVPGQIWKYNVRGAHLSACVAHSLFAEDRRRGLHQGDLLLLQLRKSDAENPHERISYVMVFDRYEPDRGERSQEYWRQAYGYLIHGDMYPLERPFSLEDLGLSKSYSVQGKIGPERIAEVDRAAVLAAVGPLG